MEESEAKICQNCKREIPAVNYTIHSVHCARNIRVCPVCKEPVPHHELQEHHEKYHKLLPCKQCGESVCGTDLEDHVRDSCAHTIKTCRFCELELPRRELPTHENYCGVRTEQCPDCKEWVMIKYRQLHLDSNHGFLRLDEDPVPQPKKETPVSQPKREALKPINVSSPIVKTEPIRYLQMENGPINGLLKNTNLHQGSSNANHFVSQGPSNGNTFVSPGGSRDIAVPGVSGIQEVRKAPLKRTNDQPQINTAVATTDKVAKDLPISRGAIKKRVAPKPPAANQQRDMSYYSALQRAQHEDRQRQAQSAYNASIGLPPVLSPAAKLEKLRKMDALHNRELETKDYKNKLQGRVWMSAEPAPGNRLGSASPVDVPLANQWADFKDLKPMSPQEFMKRFKELQLERESLSGGPVRPAAGAESPDNRGSPVRRPTDRFNEIKTSLRELRRGLNEVTAPYNSNPNATANNTVNNMAPARAPSPRAEADMEVQLPCEFCAALVPADKLVLHQTGCRPDLARFRPRSQSAGEPEASLAGTGNGLAGTETGLAEGIMVPEVHSSGLYEQPVIPCEFCTESLPIYLISEHQERCRVDNNVLF